MTVSHTTILLPPAAVAKLAGMSTATLYAWIATGFVQSQFRVEGRFVFTKEEARAIRDIVKTRRQVRKYMRLAK